jgi:soluble lytic murein transglycosylase-like protein
MVVDFNHIPDWVDQPVRQCVTIAAKEYNVPPVALLVLLRAENGKLGTASKNKNGTYDLGPMQINSRWLKDLSPYGVTSWHLAYDLCTNIRAGAWRFKSELNRTKGDVWKALGNYHSRTPYYHNRYLGNIRVILNNWYSSPLKGRK